MNSNSCGKGLVIFSITLVLGIGIASLFVSDTEISELPQTQFTEKEFLVKPKDKKVCVKEYQKFNRYIEEDNLSYAPLIIKKVELEAKLVIYNSKKLEKELEKVEKEIIRLKELEMQKKYGLKDLGENKKLLYTENCYENEF